MKKDKLAGAKIGLFFAICFILLQYPIVMSIGLAIVGAIAGNWIMQAWTDETTSNGTVELQFTKTSDRTSFDKTKTGGTEVWNKSAVAGSLLGGGKNLLKLFKKQQ